MKLQDTINKNYLHYFKQKNPLKEAYSEIKTALALKEKETKKELTDAEVKQVIETYIKKIQKSIGEFEKNGIVGEAKEVLKNEVKELEQFLDKELKGGELKEVVKKLLNEGVDNVGAFMKKIKEFGRVDMRQAKEYFEELSQK